MRCSENSWGVLLSWFLHDGWNADDGDVVVVGGWWRWVLESSGRVCGRGYIQPTTNNHTSFRCLYATTLAGPQGRLGVCLNRIGKPNTRKPSVHKGQGKKKQERARALGCLRGYDSPNEKNPSPIEEFKEDWSGGDTG